MHATRLRSTSEHCVERQQTRHAQCHDSGPADGTLASASELEVVEGVHLGGGQRKPVDRKVLLGVLRRRGCVGASASGHDGAALDHPPHADLRIVGKGRRRGTEHIVSLIEPSQLDQHISTGAENGV